MTFAACGPELNIEAGTFYNGIDGFSIKITDKDPETNRLDGIYVYDHRDGVGNSSVIYADSGYMNVTPDESGLILTLYNGHAYKDIEEKDVQQDKRKYPFRRDRFSEQTMVVELEGFGLNRSGMDIYRSNYAMLNTADLTYFIDSLSTMLRSRADAYYSEFNQTRLLTTPHFGLRGHKQEEDSTAAWKTQSSLRAAFDTELQRQGTTISRALSFAREGASFMIERAGLSRGGSKEPPQIRG
ncbi:MAG: LptF/LptG family permease [Bacteroidales bacterium]|nr:LptF/LptG family permease [Bacteroidales bacterium]